MFLHNVKHVLNQERDIIIHVILEKNKTRLKIKYFLDFFFLKQLKKKKQNNQKQNQDMSTND